MTGLTSHRRAITRSSRLFALIVGITLAAAQPAGAVSPGSNPPVASSAPFTAKVQALLGALTLDEKILLVHGGADPTPLGQAGWLPGVPRLGVPVRRDADALGINVYKDATAVPARLGIAASFDRDATARLGRLEGSEGRALGVDLLYGPQIDIARTPNWTRNQTTLGEDPYLSAQLAVPEVSGVQSKGLMDEIKHYAIYDGQAAGGGNNPNNVSSIVDDQTTHELYLPPFEDAVKKGKPSSVMCSYAAFQITPLQSSPIFACENGLLLNTILRDQWDFRGFVLSDYGGTHSTESLLNGLDQQYPNADPGFSGTYFSPAALKPHVDPASPTFDPVWAAALNTAVARVLYSYERFGLLACASDSGPVAGCNLPARPAFNKSAGIDTARTLAEEAAVLLKNSGKILPLSSSDLRRGVALVGPTADLLPSSPGGERSRGFGDRNGVSPLDALKRQAPDHSSITSSPGIDRVGTVIPAASVPGGWARTQGGVAAGTDATVNFAGSNPLTPGINYTWTGTVNVPAADTYGLWLQRSPGIIDAAGSLDPTGGRGGSNSGAVSLSVDGAVVPTSAPSTILANTYPGGPTIGGQYQGLQNNGAFVPLTAGPHTLTVGFNVAAAAAAPVYFRLTWSPVQASIDAAVAVAAAAKTAVVFVDDANSTSPAGDVNPLGRFQDQLVTAVAAANPRTVVVLNTGDPVLMPWLASVKAVLEMWYPGQEGGTATAKILRGRANPGGKLPITFPVSAAQTPFAGHPERILGVAGVTTWSEGLQVGYRWYDAQNIDPQFPFGFGLSYTKFKISRLHVSSTRDGGFDVSVRVRNVGSRRGAEVVQVYLGPSPNVPSGIQQVEQKLVQFDRVELGAGHARTVTVHIKPGDLAYWSTAGQTWVTGTGHRQIFVGNSSRNLPLSRTINVH